MRVKAKPVRYKKLVYRWQYRVSKGARSFAPRRVRGFARAASRRLAKYRRNYRRVPSNRFRYGKRY